MQQESSHTRIQRLDRPHPIVVYSPAARLYLRVSQASLRVFRTSGWVCLQILACVSHLMEGHFLSHWTVNSHRLRLNHDRRIIVWSVRDKLHLNSFCSTYLPFAAWCALNDSVRTGYIHPNHAPSIRLPRRQSSPVLIVPSVICSQCDLSWLALLRASDVAALKVSSPNCIMECSYHLLTVVWTGHIPLVRWAISFTKWMRPALSLLPQLIFITLILQFSLYIILQHLHCESSWRSLHDPKCCIFTSSAFSSIFRYTQFEPYKSHSIIVLILSMSTT